MYSTEVDKRAIEEVRQLIRRAPHGILVFESAIEVMTNRQGPALLKIESDKESLYLRDIVIQVLQEASSFTRLNLVQRLLLQEKTDVLTSELHEYVWELVKTFAHVNIEWHIGLAFFVAIKSEMERSEQSVYSTRNQHEGLLEKLSINQFLNLSPKKLRYGDTWDDFVEKEVNQDNFLKLREECIVFSAPPPGMKFSTGGNNKRPEIPAGAVSFAMARQAENASIILETDSSLVRIGFFENERASLVESRRLAGVLSLPQKQAYARNSLLANLVFVSPAHDDFRDQSIYFGTNRSSAPLPLSELTGAGSLLRHTSSLDFSSMTWHEVWPDEVAENDYELLPDRYIKSPSQKRYEQFLSNYNNCAALDEIATIVRPRPFQQTHKSFGGDGLPEKKDLHRATELLVSDLVHGDIIDAPVHRDRGLIISRNEMFKYRSQIVEPDDLLFSFKGTIAKVSLAGKSFGNPESPTFASQNVLIIRPKSFAPISQILLLNLLSTTLVGDMFSNLATGSAIKSLSIKALRSFKIPIPDYKQLAEINETMAHSQAKVEDLKRQIQLMQEELQLHRMQTWPQYLLKEVEDGS